MRKLLSICAVVALSLSLNACTTVEQNLVDSSALLLSAKEVREVFQGNTVTSANGETYYWDTSGTVTGKSAFGEKSRGNWNITDDGRLCISNWNASYAPSGCYKTYFDQTIQQRKMVDINGDLKWTVINVVTGNPNNF